MKFSILRWCVPVIATVAAPLTAQVAEGPRPSCGGNRRAVIRPGFNFSCNCTVERVEGLTELWQFRSEPRVDTVDPTAAAAKILRPGDVIVAAGDKPITTARGSEAFSRLMQGDTVKLTVRRSGQLLTVSVTPSHTCTASPSIPATRSETHVVTDGYFGLGLGLELSSPATVRTPTGFDPVWSFKQPPVVTAVVQTGPAAAGGIQPGDTIIRLNGYPITASEAGRMFGSAHRGDTVTFGVRRNGTTRTLRVIVGPESLREMTEPASAASMETAALSVQLGSTIVDLTGPATMERVGDRLVIRTRDGKVTVVVRPAVGAK